MTSFEEKLDAAVRDKLVSGAILYAKDKSGNRSPFNRPPLPVPSS